MFILVTATNILMIIASYIQELLLSVLHQSLTYIVYNSRKRFRLLTYPTYVKTLC